MSTTLKVAGYIKREDPQPEGFLKLIYKDLDGKLFFHELSDKMLIERFVPYIKEHYENHENLFRPIKKLINKKVGEKAFLVIADGKNGIFMGSLGEHDFQEKLRSLARRLKNELLIEEIEPLL
jgi:hypothetical protein